MSRQSFQEQMIELQKMQLKAFEESEKRWRYGKGKRETVFFGISQSSFQITFSYKADFDLNVLYTKKYCFS